MKNIFPNESIIPSVRDLKHLQVALRCKTQFVLLSETHIGNLQTLAKRCHEVNKKVIVHLDLIGGLNNDRVGLKMLRDLYKVDGVISPNVKSINRAKQLGLISIQRLFLLDSRSLESGLKSIQESSLDAIEVLPGPFAVNFIHTIKEITDAPILAGGFISTSEMIENLFHSGIQGITTSNLNLWKTK
ncbi:glycerol-3-phosphate responsive antiterminator [Priestia megaterium]|uniref:glycerol-3-phosphate responsive antiterminator n=1 Tax=Priestia megaterium TaxID=1404 RepID=UPI002E211E98|nr:glycerol-3-phosphate responsive antiterminator [Priestia megaterium]